MILIFIRNFVTERSSVASNQSPDATQSPSSRAETESYQPDNGGNINFSEEDADYDLDEAGNDGTPQSMETFYSVGGSKGHRNKSNEKSNELVLNFIKINS